VIQKCDFPGCGKAGACRAPKDRTLREYWHFCRAHAAEYNKNWNYYADMSQQEIEDEWERETFGESARKRGAADTAEYLKFLDDFANGRAPRRKKSPDPLPSGVSDALAALQLPAAAVWKDVQAQYRKLAKLYHPDIADRHGQKSAAAAFAKISAARAVLAKHFKA
jgi:hypothetical protein